MSWEVLEDRKVRYRWPGRSRRTVRSVTGVMEVLEDRKVRVRPYMSVYVRICPYMSIFDGYLTDI